MELGLFDGCGHGVLAFWGRGQAGAYVEGGLFGLFSHGILAIDPMQFLSENDGRVQKTFERGLWPRIFLAIQRKAAVLAVNRHQALVEMTTLDRSSGALLRDFATAPLDWRSRSALVCAGGHRA